MRSSMTPAQDPLAIACQTMQQAPYVTKGEVIIKLSKWYSNIVGDVISVKQETQIF